VAETQRILVTGAAGKVGQAFIGRLLASGDERFAGFTVRALCHNRALQGAARLEVMTGSIDQRDTADRATDGVTHVLHLATSKETPETIMDVAVKGLFWLLEACRVSPAFQQFILIGGDAGVGHFFYPHPVPVTEAQPHTAYPGCYALSKVLEEVMVEQYGIQYDLNVCCLRAPWVMEKDDFRYQLSFGDAASGAIPVMLDDHGRPVKRNFVHVNDLADAILHTIDNPAARRQTFNICMDEPVDYGELGAYLAESRGLPTVGIKTPYHSTWLDNAKAKLLLGWRPQYDLRRMADDAWSYQRAPSDPRVIWYPG
jgi:UDP-glucose 4-epimerase